MRLFSIFVALSVTIGIISAAIQPALASTTVRYGDYIKGETFSDVYVVDRDVNGNLVRRAFINEQIFFTWELNFDNVVTVADAYMSTLPFGPLVLPQSGVVLVKIQSVNKVYAIEDDELRWITSEDVAIGIYGKNWAEYVIDLPPTIFPHFVQGAPIASADYATDTSIMRTRAELIATEEEHNPFTGATLYIDPSSDAREQITVWSATRPNDADALETLASQSTAKWFGDWNNDIEASVDHYITAVTDTGALPVLVAYNIPNRDCGGYSIGGSETDDAYREWITSFAAGIGTRQAVVILEPDATATDCVTDARLALIGEAVNTLKAQPHVSVYIDAGHDNWIDAATMAARLQAANITEANGFALNVANFYTTEENIAYGTTISTLVNDKHFVIDTSRNGNGSNGEWCNPSGRHIGAHPTTNTGYTLVDALLWVKPPGESDGTCNGGPSAGAWWAEYALNLVQ